MVTRHVAPVPAFGGPLRSLIEARPTTTPHRAESYHVFAQCLILGAD